jgi:precorrin-4 methylase
MAKVWFVGAGPGDPDLITVRGRDLIARAGAILYAGSLVSATALRWAPPGCAIADSKDMDLEAIAAWLIDQAGRHACVVRLQTGDPGLYGALIEMVQPLDAAGIEVGVVPGISSALASAAAAVESLTLPEVTQTVILTRVAGRTPMPEGESLAELRGITAPSASFCPSPCSRRSRPNSGRRAGARMPRCWWSTRPVGPAKRSSSAAPWPIFATSAAPRASAARP